RATTVLESELEAAETDKKELEDEKKQLMRKIQDLEDLKTHAAIRQTGDGVAKDLQEKVRARRQGGEGRGLMHSCCSCILQLKRERQDAEDARKASQAEIESLRSSVSDMQMQLRAADELHKVSRLF